VSMQGTLVGLNCVNNVGDSLTFNRQ
jgi:hypothetical protein